MGQGKSKNPPVIWGLRGPRFFANFSDIRNLLLRTSPRFFDRSDPNHCRNVLWKVNINYYRKKVKISTQFCNGAPKRWKVEGHVYEKNYNSWTKWDIFTKLDTHVNDKDLWSKKNYICRFATWWRKKYKKNCSWVTVGPIDLKFGIQYLCPKGNKRLWGHLRISKNMAAIGQTNLNTY